MMQNSADTRPVVIGITGITGSGTSTLANFFKTIDSAFVISADEVSHEVLHGEAHDEVVRAFGSDIVRDGQICRKRLGGIVFQNPTSLGQLKAILHPKILQRIKCWISDIEDMPSMHTKFAVIDAPLLIESGLNHICDRVWLVIAPEKERIARLKARSGLDEAEAKRRISIRQSDNALRQHANLVFVNDADIAALQQKAWTAINNIFAEYNHKGT